MHVLHCGNYLQVHKEHSGLQALRQYIQDYSYG